MLARLTLTVEDADGDRAPVSAMVSIDDATTLTDAVELYLHPFFNVIYLFLQGSVVEASMSIIPDTSTFVGFGNTPTALSDVEEKALFKFATARGVRVVEMTVPTFYEGYFVNSGAGKEVIETDTDIQAFYVLMTNGVEDGGIDAVDSHGDDISRAISGFQQFRGRKKKR